MDLNEYQRMALATDQMPDQGGSEVNRGEVLVPLLGLASEVGELLGEYKKCLRDNKGQGLSVERVRDELGDVLWYLSNVATKFGLDLEQVARWNLEKVGARWGASDERLTFSLGYCFDTEFPEEERFPRRFRVAFGERYKGATEVASRENTTESGLDNDLTMREEDRFQAVFHLAFAAVLGWSPIVRAKLGRERRSVPKTVEIEDGRRAIAIEEGIAAMVVIYAEQHCFAGIGHCVNYDLLRTIKDMTAHLEVANCTVADWQRAIRTGFELWEKLQNRGDTDLIVDLNRKSVEILQ